MATRNSRDFRQSLAILEFKQYIKNFEKINGENIYDLNQDNLAVLKRTGQGNCVAFNKLFNSICKKRKIKFYLIVVKNLAIKDFNHQVSLIYDVKQRIFWLQSNQLVIKLKSYQEIMKCLSLSLGWKPKAVIPIEISEG